MSHTPEPWNIITLNEYTDGIIGNYGKQDIGQVQVPPDNAHRIVTCVNGCTGLNPAAYRECVEVLKALKAQRGMVRKATARQRKALLRMLLKTVEKGEQAIIHAEGHGP